MPNKKSILVAPLHWGLGHATRCIPLIRSLLANDFDVLLGSDGAALLLLKKEFPQLPWVELPSYNITYPKNAKSFKWKILLHLPLLIQAILKEKRIVAQLVAEGKVDGIISDNRLGVRNDHIPSVYITHQIRVLSGATTYLSSKIHQRVIRKFDACWVPDVCDPTRNCSGRLGHIEEPPLPLQYLGILSRMEKKKIAKTIDILVLLSGPEPQRTLFETQLKTALKGSGKMVTMVCGKIEDQQRWINYADIKMVNFMLAEELEDTINKSEIVIARPGYTTLMDLAAMEKKAFFIPTPGQYEQEYLAKRLESLGLAPTCKQGKFHTEKLNEIRDYTGLGILNGEAIAHRDLFSIFKGE